MSDGRVAVLGGSWTRAPQGEMAAAVRSIAGAFSRLAAVDVFVPGDASRRDDGAFDLTPLGAPAGTGWPATSAGNLAARFPAPGTPRHFRAVLVEAGDDGARALAASLAPGAPVLSVGRAEGATDARLAVDLVPGTGTARLSAPGVHPTGLYARVHLGASSRRHYGLRSTPGYVLVLGDRPGAPTSPWPSGRVRWLLARFARRYLVVVEGGVARVWRSRSCVTAFEVHTRMDLWILMARAAGVVDLRPGEVFARECVESLRYGVPVAVPAGSAAEGLTRSGGGLRFSSTAELLSCVDALFDPATRETFGSKGKEVVDHWYGDPDGLVTRLAGALASLESRHGDTA